MRRSLPCLISMLCASVALAEPPAAPAGKTQHAVSQLVDKQLLAPLRKAESRRSRFSRAAPVAVERRVRVLDTEALTDVRGKTFLRFAIDERRSWDDQGVWKKDSVVGCAYLNERELFVRHGRAYAAARSMLGEAATDREDVCRAASESTAHTASRTARAQERETSG